MGLIQVFKDTVGGALEDQWREFFVCEDMTTDVLARRGQKARGKRSSNKGDDNVISNGSIISVAVGQFMLITDQGKIVDFTDQPGEYVFDQSSAPSFLYNPDGLGESIRKSFENAVRRFTFAGHPSMDQRVYYFNTKEIRGNKYGTPNPVPFNVSDPRIGLNMVMPIRCHGEYSYRIANPLLFFTNVTGNISGDYLRVSDNLDAQLKSELMTALQPAFAQISAMGIEYHALPLHTMEIADKLNDVLSSKWLELRGITIASFGVSSVTASEEDVARLQRMQAAAIYRDPTMAAAELTSAQSEAMREAAKNPNAGPVMAFAGLNMATQAGGMNPAQLLQMGQQGNQGPQGGQPGPQGTPPPSGDPAPVAGGVAQQPQADGWTCACGTDNTGKFCVNCGKGKPAPAPANATWNCSCGEEGNTGKFCTNCGSPRPSQKSFKCDKCGWVPKDPANPPKFCPDCGDVFDESDASTV